MRDDNCIAFSFEMIDWICALQYEQSPDPRYPMWRGGFKNIANGKLMSIEPTIDSAGCAQALADCCRLIRNMPNPDIKRYERYRSCLIQALQFLNTLQFTESNSLHIAINYRTYMIGSFHYNIQDGNIRVDQTAMSVSAFIQFLSAGIDREK